MDDEKIPVIKQDSPSEPPRYGSLQSPSLTAGGSTSSYKVYPGRFYVLTVFTLLVLLQSFAWMTFGTIPVESDLYFGLNDDDVTLIAGKHMS